MAKRDRYEDDDNDFLEEGMEEWDAVDDLDDDDERDFAESDESDGEEDDDDGAEPDDNSDGEEVESEEAAQAEVAEPEPEPEPDYPPDDEKAVAALKKLRVRLDVTPKGNVWRAIFDDANGRDQNLVLLNGLPALKELWLIGTRVSQQAADGLKSERPKMTVYY